MLFEDFDISEEAKQLEKIKEVKENLVREEQKNWKPFFKALNFLLFKTKSKKIIFENEEALIINELNTDNFCDSVTVYKKIKVKNLFKTKINTKKILELFSQDWDIYRISLIEKTINKYTPRINFIDYTYEHFFQELFDDMKEYIKNDLEKTINEKTKEVEFKKLLKFE